MQPLLRRLLLVAGSAGAVACGARGDLAETGLGAIPGLDDGVDLTDTASSGGASAGSGGSTAGAAGAKAGSGGSAAGSGGSAAGSGGKAGSKAVCDDPSSPPKNASGSFECGAASFGICELRCYAPGAKTLPGPCRQPDDPELLKLPVFQPEGCGFTKPSIGPFCNAETEKLAGASPVCCYLGESQPCAGRPLAVDGAARLASLRAGSW